MILKECDPNRVPIITKKIKESNTVVALLTHNYGSRNK